jgi:hypothetical protein
MTLQYRRKAATGPDEGMAEARGAAEGSGLCVIK